jgi:hypothetical protein
MTEDRGVFASNDEAPPEFNLHALVHEDLDEGPIGIFPTWRWVYGTVIVFSLVTVVVLYYFSAAMDFSAG